MKTIGEDRVKELILLRFFGRRGPDARSVGELLSRLIFSDRHGSARIERKDGIWRISASYDWLLPQPELESALGGTLIPDAYYGPNSARVESVVPILFEHYAFYSQSKLIAESKSVSASNLTRQDLGNSAYSAYSAIFSGEKFEQDIS